MDITYPTDCETNFPQRQTFQQSFCFYSKEKQISPNWPKKQKQQKIEKKAKHAS